MVTTDISKQRHPISLPFLSKAFFLFPMFRALRNPGTLPTVLASAAIHHAYKSPKIAWTLYMDNANLNGPEQPGSGGL